MFPCLKLANQLRADNIKQHNCTYLHETPSFHDIIFAMNDGKIYLILSLRTRKRGIQQSWPFKKSYATARQAWFWSTYVTPWMNEISFHHQRKLLLARSMVMHLWFKFIGGTAAGRLCGVGICMSRWPCIFFRSEKRMKDLIIKLRKTNSIKKQISLPSSVPLFT